MTTKLDKEFYRLHWHPNNDPKAMPWIIWLADSPYKIQRKIPTFDEGYSFRKNFLIFKDDKIYLSNELINPGPWDATKWTEVQPGVGFVSEFTETTSYVLDEFVLHNNKFYMTTRNTTPGPFNPADWAEVVTLSRIETGTIYVEDINKYNTSMVVDGTLILLGGEPDPIDVPNTGDTFLDIYFRDGGDGTSSGDPFQGRDRLPSW